RPNSPVLISATVNGSGDGSSGGVISFNPLHQNQRSALLLLNGIVYIAWAAHCDWGPYHGWLMGYDKSTLQQRYVYNTTPEGYNGGIWMSGGGPSADAAGNIYAAVGNGTVGYNGDPANTLNRSESAIKLAPSGNTLSVQSFFTPQNYPTLEGADLDFGVTQLLLIPGSKRAAVGVKDGRIYILDQDNLGGYSATTNNVVQTIDLGSNSFLRSSMAYIKGSKEYLYSWSENSLLRGYPFDRSTNNFDVANTLVSGLQGPTGHSGAVLSTSSNGSIDSTGILWASYASTGDANQLVCPGILRAVDASDVTKELWNSSMVTGDNPGNYAKFSCPTIANGKVYLASFSNQLNVYGLTGITAADTCNGVNIALNKPAVASSLENASYPATNVNDGNIGTRWSSQFSDPQSVDIDLGSRYDICKVVLHWEAAIGRDFKIQTSEDGTAWTDVSTITGNSSPDNYIPVRGSGRYVRMYGTQRLTTDGYSLWEFEVYGKPSTSDCGVPASLAASNITQTGVKLEWSTAGAQSVIQYKTVTALNWAQTTSNTLSVTLSDLACNIPYLFRVRTVCSPGDSSDFSAPAGFTTLPCNGTCDPLPTRWSTEDVGNTALAGAACYTSATGTFDMKGSGDDIGGKKDAFRFAYKTEVGSGELIARVLAVDNSSGMNKSGIMVRESLAEGSRFAFIGITNRYGAVFETRSVTDGTASEQYLSNVSPPYWIKLTSSGTTFAAFVSPDGLNWSQVGSASDAAFGDGTAVYSGLAITSHNNAVLSATQIDNFNAGGVMPLQLLSFTGSLGLGKAVHLNWVATLDIHTRYFVIERTKDFMNFTTIDTVDAATNGGFTQDYDASDSRPPRGTVYYRLKIIDENGVVSYSPYVAIKVTDEKAPRL
ncbi:MAG TPA: discoidin domain-containing protein, partial [Chitinophagaceae bacterium]